MRQRVGWSEEVSPLLLRLLPPLLLPSSVVRNPGFEVQRIKFGCFVPFKPLELQKKDI
jgi:hypothetical protein